MEPILPILLDWNWTLFLLTHEIDAPSAPMPIGLSRMPRRESSAALLLRLLLSGVNGSFGAFHGSIAHDNKRAAEAL